MEAMTVTVRSAPSQLRAMRRTLRAWLRDADVEDAEAVVLAVNEAVANAIVHSGSDEDIVVEGSVEEGSASMEVRDLGRWRTAVVGPGHGLAIMRALARDVEISHKGGTTVRMTFPAVRTRRRESASL